MTQEPWTHAYATTNGIRMHYVTQGDGPLVVLLHGFPEFWYSWRHQIPALAQHFKVVAPDLRGYNETDAPPGGYDTRTLAADVRGLVEALGYHRATIAGHDWGGGVAWAFAYYYPEVTERLIILNAPHPALFIRGLPRPDQLLRSWYMFFFQLPVLPERIMERDDLRMLQQAFQGARGPVLSAEDLARYKAAFRRHGFTGPINYYRALFRPRSLRERGLLERKLRVPTLVIWGEQDVALGKRLTYGMDRYVEDVRVRYIPSAGHWVQQEEPERVNRYMLDFLSDLSGKRDGGGAEWVGGAG